MMEPIPEEDHESLSLISPHHSIQSNSSSLNNKRIIEEKQRMREIYKSEQINTVVSTIPKTELPVSWNMSPTEKITTITTTDENVLLSPTLNSTLDTSQNILFHTHIPQTFNQNNSLNIEGSTNNGIGTTYNYTYECHYDDPITSEIESADFSEANDQDIERHFKQTQKVTKVTKVTTTRSVRQIDLSKGDIHFDAEGSPIIDESPYNMDKDSQIDEMNHDLSNICIKKNEEYQNDAINSGLQSHISYTNNLDINNKTYDDINNYNKNLPRQPGIPQVTDIDSTEVSLIWLHPPNESPNTPIIGYKVEYRRGEDDPWEAAHDDLLVQSECRITNLEPMADYQFRVLAANINGFGLPSQETPPILLRPKFDSTNRRFDQYQHFNAINDSMAVGKRNDIIECQQPGPPIPIEINGDTISLEWRPSVSNDISTPITGYIVEYKAKGLDTWMQANDFLIPTHYYTVSNLRPNGEYEFRVIGRCIDVYSKPSLSSGMIKIKPTIPTRSGIITYNKSLPIPDQPFIVETYHDSVLINVTSSSSSKLQIPVSQTIEYREIGDPNWYVAKIRQLPPNILVTNLRPNNSYEFRAFTVSLYDGSRSPSSVKSDAVQLIWSNIFTNNNLQNVPKKPFTPEYVGAESADSLIICWLPAESSLPIQGYEVEFRDYQQDSHNWYKVTDTLVTGCKTTVGYLLQNHQYQFRIIAKNAMGFSEPSEPSETITITENGPTTRSNKWIPIDGETSLSPIKSPKYVEAERYGTIPLLQDEMIRESPPLPERDDSPPPINRQINVQWRDPTLKEVIDYLSNNDINIVINASGLLQHLSYNDNIVKEDIRNLGGIPILIKLLNNDNSDVVRNSAGCLRNLSFGKENDINKKMIAECDGIRWLTTTIKHFPNSHVREEATGALWNISSCDELKISIYNQCAEVIVDTLVIPLSGYKNSTNKHLITIGDNDNLNDSRGRSSNVFRNGVGILRNISAINSNSRKQLRNSPLLIESLLFYLQNSFNHNLIDSRSVENVVCVLRNLSYRVHEEYVGKKHPYIQEHRDSQRNSGKRNRERSKSAPSGSPKEKKKSSGLFKKSGKNKKDNSDDKENNVSGGELLWHISTIQLYLRLLQETSNSETLEAASAAIQNLSASEHSNSQYVRTLVRTEKGLPILVELLKVEFEKVVCSVTTALRNLSMDQRNRELIGKYAMKDLLQKIPREKYIEKLDLNENKVAEATIAAVLGILFEIVKYSVEFTKNFHDIGGTEKLMILAKSYPNISAKICKYASQLLYTMWQHKELHETFKKAGYKEIDFYSGPSTSRNTAREARTLARPIISHEGNKKSNKDNDYGSDNYAIYDIKNTPQSARYDYGNNNKYENGNNDINSVRSDSKIITTGGKYKKVTNKEPLYTAVQKKEHNYINSPAGDSWV
ncbi:Armadillo repeat and Fibronectin, type III domain and Armadillo-like helical domain and Immunoglobulin-like fold domain and Armadillo-type fold domain-containing protein [Strongyloides ratti]|uniref:Armadillo repeat and Fibronectin, type III domain and Armadillo-like helical domain and Immunoglobulin-like fold domain and Armadillo-type fold domain-containing protein n=1 Tax=Strongyloides ratti TaxID=34506 RepID=A0A090MRB7_STRRB|nr:Armadillo repeat and Fibronectin, type III domain and Armadillo-like helical domain and Immunoglobulin-like fold domain and Armadillo-type fold domain-containing protein [Strongyloides ratti]CEF60743.1 Armadillo repeat and Fibronectin, type III domain and Armadillo-like helical domain and Immunoglobulin-like fold domain and Armadillo-type fold domain-containing protein [Strongyloides ratti]